MADQLETPDAPLFQFYQTTRFTRWVKKNRLGPAVEKLKADIQADPEVGDVIPSGDGLRKIRTAGLGRGKSGGFRVVYALVLSRTAAILFTGYSKADQADLSDDELKSLVSDLAGMRAVIEASETEDDT